MIKSPMLASDYEESKLVFPKLASPKIDGYRAHEFEGVLSTRSGKSVQNAFIQDLLGHKDLHGLDGELIVGEMNDPEVFNKTSSGVRRRTGEPDFKWIIFDDYSDHTKPFKHRIEAVKWRVESLLIDGPFTCLNERLYVLPHSLIENLEQMDEYEAKMLGLGFEGIMLRGTDAAYKFGRSSVNEGGLLKVKRFVHDEAIVVGFEELMHNGNDQVINELGRTKRSSAKEGLYRSGMLGAYIVKSPKYEKEFNVSCGSMTHAERKRRWDFRAADLGNLVRFKHFPHGAKDVPRHGLYAGFRDPADL